MSALFRPAVPSSLLGTQSSGTQPPSGVDSPSLGTSPVETPTALHARRPDPSGPRPLVYAAIIVVVIVAVAGVAYVVTGGFHRNSNGTSEVILITNQTQWSIPIGQFNGIAFIAGHNSSVNGTLYESGGLQIYTMTPTQYARYIKTDVVPGYEWTSGRIANDSLYQLAISVSAGQWDVAFSDPFLNITYANTLVAFYTDVVLTPE